MSKWSAWPAEPIKDLSEIRRRHARDESRSSLWDNNPYVMHRDRGWLLAEVERLRADLVTQQGCCDGAAAQDAHIRREREEHRAQIERLRGAMRWYADLTNYVGPVISVFDPPPALLDKGALAREALEAKP